MITTTIDHEFLAACAGDEWVGFHGTSSLACSKIEVNGFLPDKVFSDDCHQKVLKAATHLNITIYDYVEWLNMRSVTFTVSAQEAIDHVDKQKNSGGQGLTQMLRVLAKIEELGDKSQKEFAAEYKEQINKLRVAPAVIYAVDLSNLAPRLVKDKQGRLYQHYWSPDLPLPQNSEIHSDRIIARLDLPRSTT